jgi:anti-sigma regulatory factor (Ser/Thr protein kinase)
MAMGGKRDQQELGGSVNLSLEARPANAALARQAIADEAAQARLDAMTTAAAQVVVTEGFSNAVRHAYPNGDGQVHVEAHGDEHGITILVRDRGVGVRPTPRAAGTVGGIGLLLVAALAERLQLRRLPQGGTELEARVAAAQTAAR